MGTPHLAYVGAEAHDTGPHETILFITGTRENPLMPWQTIWHRLLVLELPITRLGSCF